MMKYIIDTINSEDMTAGFKARNDIDCILVSEGFEKRYIVTGKNKKAIFSEVRSVKNQIKVLFKDIAENSLVAVQYPWRTMGYKLARVIYRCAAKKKCKTVVIIHDLNSVRTQSKITKLYYKLYVKEIKFLDIFDYIICHNECMKKYLVRKGIHEEKIIPLELFDYLLEEFTDDKDKIIKRRVRKKDVQIINIAGNLSKGKAEYVYELFDMKIKNYSINLCGPFYQGGGNDNINYLGAYGPMELPLYIHVGFGLIWDGGSIKNCENCGGAYLRINNPHKLSLYIACGIPVIVWKYAAVASFVEKHKIGYCVESLLEIDDIMMHITEEEYQLYKDNVSKIQKKVRNGDYLKGAMRKIKHD